MRQGLVFSACRTAPWTIAAKSPSGVRPPKPSGRSATPPTPRPIPNWPTEWINAISHFCPATGTRDLALFCPKTAPVATRAASGKALNALAQRIPTLMGGSADLAPSNNTFLKGLPEFQKGSYEGRNIRFGVREHAMGAIMSGMFLHGGIRPYGGTFLVFADYVRPAIRVAALMKLPLIYVFTHDSIAVGEDGPTHQPVEHLASCAPFPT
jgi:transketolase